MLAELAHILCPGINPSCVIITFTDDTLYVLMFGSPDVDSKLNENILDSVRKFIREAGRFYVMMFILTLSCSMMNIIIDCVNCVPFHILFCFIL